MLEQYFVTVEDSYGQKTVVEVTREIWELFDAERKAVERQRNEYRRHGDKRGLEDYVLSNHSFAVSDTLEEQYFRRERLKAAYEVLKSCTSIQQERFYLNRICGYTLYEIADMQGCGVARVHKSIAAVLDKLKNI